MKQRTRQSVIRGPRGNCSVVASAGRSPVSPTHQTLRAGVFAALLFLSGCGDDGDPVLSKPEADVSVSHDSTRHHEKLPLENVVGSQACQECHPEVFEAWQQTGHARTFGPAHDVPFIDQLDGYEFHDRVRDVTFRYHVTGDQVEVSIPVVFGAERFPLQYAFGSGAHAISFLTLLPDVKGGSLGLEHRVSWYRETGSFGLTPKHDELEAVQDSEMFGRIVHRDIVGGCIDCHVTTSDVQNQQVVNLEPDVGCESCHGAGRAHINAINQGLSDLKIGFSAGNWQSQDEIRICGKCHRTTDDIPEPVIRTDEMRIVRFQSVGLVQSKCYQQSGQRLSCTTCHDPHHSADSRTIDSYESKCLQCHSGVASETTAQTVCPKSAETGCIGCHMPAIEVNDNVFFYDHWIRVRERDGTSAAAGSGD